MSFANLKFDENEKKNELKNYPFHFNIAKITKFQVYFKITDHRL